MTTIVCISDTHQQEDKLVLPEGDILVHAGDITWNGSLEKLKLFNMWLGGLDFKHKIVIAGNHDWCFAKPSERMIARAILTNATYLEDSGTEAMGLKFWGSPWQPWFHDWAFNLHRGSALKRKWNLIPEDTDVLITHGPPYRYGDRTNRGELVGCRELLHRVQEIKPSCHIFGHIHEDPGVWEYKHFNNRGEDTGMKTSFVNASNCNLSGSIHNPPIVINV